MRLKSGHPAVPFTAQSVDGEAVSLAQFCGEPLLIMFLRYSSCPMCNLRLHDFAQEYARLRERGLKVLVFFHSSAPSIRAHAGARHYPFPLVADPGFQVYGKYGVETSWARLLLSITKPSFYGAWLRSMRHRFWGGAAWQMAKMPADFLIAPNGRIVVAHYGRDIGDHLPVAEIDAFLDGVEGAARAGNGVSFSWDPIPNPEVAIRSSYTGVALSLVWALALVASSFFLEGRAVGEWVDSFLYVAAGVWASSYLVRRPAFRCG